MENILSHIRTKSEAEELLECLDKLSTNLYSTKKLSIKDYFLNLPKDLSDIILETLGKEPMENMDKDNIKTIISQLQRLVRSCTTIEITTAFQPNDHAITAFSTWLKNNTNENALLDLNIDKKIVGGAIIISNGKYKDYSVSKKLTQIFQIQKDEILGLI